MSSSSEEQSVLSASAVSEVGTIEQNLRAHQCHPAPSPVPKEPQLCGCELLTHKAAQLGEDQSSDEGLCLWRWGGGASVGAAQSLYLYCWMFS